VSLLVLVQFFFVSIYFSSEEMLIKKHVETIKHLAIPQGLPTESYPTD
jgi:hypothetical protein